jgi:CDP-diacylglycerol--inositol 3-phosphatidyltransferase
MENEATTKIQGSTTTTTTKNPALYIPNILGYIRIVSAVFGLVIATPWNNPVAASFVWIFSASLDLFDGILARRLNQLSSFGILLDVIADNILRASLWIAAATANKDSNFYSVVAIILISIEWITMVCTQLHANTNTHWKEVAGDDDIPWWIQAIFVNNFKSPLGILCIGGLFGSGFMAFASGHSVLVDAIPYFHTLKYTSFFGRAISFLAELWLCRRYLTIVIRIDQENANLSTRKRDD